MTTTASLGTLAANRYQAMLEQRQQQAFSQRQEKQNQSEDNNNTSIELPSAIKDLITGSDYWITAKSNRYKKLIREGHLNNLLELAKLALTKNNPSNWFAKVCSVKAWERTLDFLKKLHDVQKKAETIIKRIGEGVEKLIYKQIWKGKSVERHAVAAQELPHTKPNQSKVKLFAWLCRQEGQGTAAQNPA